MSDQHFRIVNPAVQRRRAGLRNASQAVGCGLRQDAPVCTNGQTDVTCVGEIYRGCQTGQTDCANNPQNPDDSCCSGWIPGNNGDNIDHASCTVDDAPWGGFSLCFFEEDGPQNQYPCLPEDSP